MELQVARVSVHYSGFVSLLAATTSASADDVDVTYCLLPATRIQWEICVRANQRCCHIVGVPTGADDVERDRQRRRLRKPCRGNALDLTTPPGFAPPGLKEKHSRLVQHTLGWD